MRPGNAGVVAGRRYYSPGIGRWTSRDPIGETGGLNLYTFVRNRATDGWDLYGLLFGIGEPAWPDDDGVSGPGRASALLVAAVGSPPGDGVTEGDAEGPRAIWHREVPACTVFIAYGHHWRGDEKRGLQNIRWTVVGPCSYAAPVACFASELPNPWGLPGYPPVSGLLNPSYTDPPPTLPNELKKATDAAKAQARACCDACLCTKVTIKFEGFGRSIKEVFTWPSPRDEVFDCARK